MAESALAMAIEEVLSDESFGEDRSPASTVRFLPEEGPEDARGLVIFNKAQAGDRPFSTNNFAKENSIRGWSDRLVPQHGVHLVGIGSYNGVERRVEAVLVQPAFPFVVASNGPIHSSGGLLVAGVDSSVELTRGVKAIDPALLKPGDLVSNADQRGAIQLGSDTTVTGKLETPASKADLGVLYNHADPDTVNTEAAKIDVGEIKYGADPEELPKINLSKYDPRPGEGRPGRTIHRELKEKSYPDPEKVLKPGEPLKGTILATPPEDADGKKVSFTDGLELDGALLFVDGDVEIWGGLKGVGAVVATGSVAIHDGTALQSDNNTAVLAGGDINLSGTDQESSYFQGLLYTEGTLEAEQITLVGTLIARADEGGSETTLNNVNLVHNPENTSVEFELEKPSRGGGGSLLANTNPIVMVARGTLKGPGLSLQLTSRDPYRVLCWYVSDPPGTEQFYAGTFANMAGVTAWIERLAKSHGGGGKPVNEVLLAEWLENTPLDRPPYFYHRLWGGGKGTGGGGGGGDDDPPTVITIDPSDFLRFENRVRIALWREL